MTNKEKTYWVDDTMMMDQYYRENNLNNENGQYYRKPNNFNIQKLFDKTCLGVSTTVGTALANGVNPNHFQDVYQEFADGRYFSGAFKALYPYVVPYGVSLFVKRKTEKKFQGRITELERKIEEMTK